MKLTLLILSIWFFNQITAQNWNQLSDFPGTSRDDAVVFTIADKAYCGTGQTPSFNPAKDFYSFDFNTQQWSQVANLPTSQGRQYASGFDNDTLGFVFGGENGNTYFNELFAYDPANDSWTAKSTLPSDGRSGFACFTIENKAYIVGGRTEELTFSDEVWEYDMTTDIWTQKANFPYGNKWRITGTSNDTSGYVIFGFDDTLGYANELYEYNPTADTWSIVSYFPDEARNYASIQYLNNQLIVLFGMDSTNQFYNDVHLYNLTTNLWETGPSLPDISRRGGQVFTTGLDLFYTTGLLNTPARTRETWIFDNPTSDIISPETMEMAIFPCPTANVITIKPSSYSEMPQTIVVHSLDGKRVATFDINNNETQLDISDLSSGTYFIALIDHYGNRISQSKFVKR